MTKRYRLAAAAHNLARIMRLLFGIGKPRVLQAPADLVWLVQFIVIVTWRWLATAERRWSVVVGCPFMPAPPSRRPPKLLFVHGLLCGNPATISARQLHRLDIGWRLSFLTILGED